MSLFTTTWSGIVWFFGFFFGWVSIFAAPFQRPEMLWIVVPIYINWIFTDFFQERRRTAIGNAITNGAVVLWVSIDWARTMVSSFSSFDLIVYIKFGLLALFVIYGLVIIFEGIRGKDFVTKLGRVRETSYLMIMATPFVYGVLELTLTRVIAVLVFFPVFYFLIEFINHKILPMLGIGKIEKGEEKLEGKEAAPKPLGEMPKMPDLGNDFRKRF